MSFFAAVDLNSLLQFIVTVFILGGCFLYLVKNTASNYFLVEEETDCYNNNVTDWSSAASSSSSSCTSTSAAATTTTFSNRNSVVAETTGNMGGERLVDEACAVCGNRTKKFCARCKMVNYCSAVCQTSHWKSEHKKKCGGLKLSGSLLKRKVSGGSCNIMSRAKKILFPYEEFVEFFNWDRPGFPPCGLINCGNSCFANVVLQCLAYTKPLVAFLLEKGHRRECRRNDWCFLCEFQNLVEKASQSSQPFSPINILSRLPNMGGNLGYGKQEDAHEFMRFAIDTMQSACLDNFGGEKALHPSSQETTLIQHIFGGHLQSQVICTKCKNVSNQFENMMDLTVEIHGDATSLEKCLDQFTAKEWLHGDNMYKCDGCNDYVMAWKHLTVRCAPNILTIALKRFQSGRFGKLNKRVTFPETLDLSPYMSEGGGQDSNIYKLYAVIVHLDMLNASFFGHYVCYIKDFRGNWYRIDDCKVISVGLDEVLSQGAYMLLYSRICARSSSLYPVELSEKSEPENVKVEMDVIPSSVPPFSEEYIEESCSTVGSGLLLPSEEISEFKDKNGEETVSSSKSYPEDVKLDLKVEDLQHKSVDSMDVDTHEEGSRTNDQPSPFEPAHTTLVGDNMLAIHSDDADVVKFTLPSSSLLVEGGNGGLTVGTTESSFSDSYDVPVATENHVDAEENIPVSVSSAASTSDLVCNERESTNNGEQTVNTFTGHPQGSVVPDAGGLLNGRRSRSKSKPLLSPGFLDKHRPKKSMKQEGEVLGLGEQVPNSKLNFQTNGVVKPDPMKQESCCTVVSGSLLPSEEISEYKDASGEERLLSSVRYSDDVNMDLEVEDLQHNSVDAMDVDICEEEGSRTKPLPSEPVHTMVLGDNLSSRVNSNNSDTVNVTALCSSSVVEDGNVGLTGDATESSFTDTYVQVATDNHVDADASTSSLVCNEQGSNSNGEQTVKTSSEDPQRVVPNASGTLNGKLSRSPSKPLLSPGFLDKRQPKKLTKQKGEVL